MDVKKARRDHRAIGFALLAYLLLQLLVSLPLLFIKPGNFTAVAVMMFFSTFAGGMAALLCCWWAGYDWKPILTVRRGLRRQTINALAALISTSFFSGIVVAWLNDLLQRTFGVEATTANFSLKGDFFANLMMVLAVVVAAPFFEELFFRGVLLGVLSRYGARYGVIVSAVLFGLFHGNLPQGVGATFIGLVLGWLALKTQSIVPCIGAHMLYNGFVLLCSSGVESGNLMVMSLMGLLYLGASVAATVYLAVLIHRIHPSLPPPTELERELGWRRFWRCIPIWLTLIACGVMTVLSIR